MAVVEVDVVELDVDVAALVAGAVSVVVELRVVGVVELLQAASNISAPATGHTRGTRMW